MIAGIVALSMTAGIGLLGLPAGASSDHYQASREAAAQGMVLLKNEHAALPLPDKSKVALFGMNQIDYVDGGGGAATVNAEYKVSLLQGMQNKEKEGKVELYKPLVDAYTAADKTDTNPKGRKNQINLTDELLNGAKDFADTAIISIGRFTEEGTDMEEGPGGYELTQAEQDMVNKVCAAGFDRVAVVLNVATAVDTSWFYDNENIDAALMAWLGGMEGGNAMADILCGDVNPSGKLPDTLVKSFEDYHSSDFHESMAYVNYTEDIFVGYRYFETIPGAAEKVNYEFGYGLSYTTFALSGQKVEQDGDNIKATVTVKNTGGRAGREVVQVYYSAPQGKLGKAAKELAGFAKTRELSPGESQTLTVTFAVDDMASYDDLGKTGHKSAYVMEAGDYGFYVGTSVRDCEKSSYVYTLNELKVVEQLSQKLTSKRLEKRLLADGTYEELDAEIADTTCQVKAEGISKMECENYIDADRNIAIEMPETGACVSYFNQDRYVVYDLRVEQAGTYNVVLRAANGHGPLTNYMAVYVNDQKQDVSTYIEQTGFDSGNRWFTFVDCKPFQLTLPEGKVKLKLVCTVGEGPNLDYLTFERVGSQAKAAAATVPSGEPNAKTTLKAASASASDAAASDDLILLEDVYNNPDLMDAFLDQMTVEELAELTEGQAGGSTGGIGGLRRLGIPAAGTADGPLGLHLGGEYKCTSWPCAILLASTFDTDLIQEIAQKIGDECLDANIDVLLGPSLNIHRNPLCGRNFEYYSEDPLVSGKMAAAFVKGVQSKGIAATMKHFAINNKENNRRACDSRVTERAAREIYLRGFKIAIDEADPWAIMSAYNPINGIKASMNEELLTGILREEWGYQGLVMSDWDTGASHTQEALAGGDVKMPTGSPSELVKAVNDPENPLTREILEQRVENVLNFVMKTRVFYNRLHYTPDEISDGTRLKVAEIFWDKSDNVKAEACADEGGGLSLGYCEPGEWLTYKVNVKQSGKYDLRARIASERDTGAFQVLMDGQVIADFPAQASTGGWQSWKTTDPIQVNLTAGEHEMKILFTGSVLNLNWLEFTENQGGGESSSTPSEPSKPSEPSEPSNPSTPSEPSGPSEPSAPSKPEEPSGPSEPQTPTEPETPVQGGEGDNSSQGSNAPSDGNGSNNPVTGGASMAVIASLALAGAGAGAFAIASHKRREQR